MSEIPAAEDGRFVVSVRPTRMAYLIAEGSRDGFRRAVRYASTRWGGAREPIIEVPAAGELDSRSWWIVEHANVDGVLNIDAPPVDAERAVDNLIEGGASDPQRIRLIADGRYFDAIHPADLADSPRTVDGSNGFVIADHDAPLWHAAAAGDLSADQELIFGPGTMQVRRARHEIEIGEAQMWGHTLLGRTVESFGESTSWPGPATKPAVIWLTSGDTLADCIGFWNLRALSPVRSASMPIYLLPAEIAGWTTFPRLLLSSVRARGAWPTPDVIMTSASVGAEALAGFAEALGMASIDLGTRRPAMPEQITYTIKDPFPGVLVNRRYGEQDEVEVPVLRDRATLRFPSPVALSRGACGSAQLGVTGRRLALIPRRSVTAALIGHGARWRGDELVFEEFIADGCRLDLKLPTPEAACRAVLTEVTASHRIGEKAALGLSLMNPETLAVLSSPHAHQAINALTKKRAVLDLQGALRGNQALTDQQHERLTQLSGSFKRLFKQPEKLGIANTAAALAALERLAGIGWVERGLATKCGACGLESFIPLSTQTASGPACCPECAAETAYADHDGGIAVHYRLDARVDHANSQGVLAHLLAIGTLARERGPAWLVPGVEMIFATGERRETDLFGVCDGKLVCGEVKMSSLRFTPEQIDKDIDTAARLGAEIHVMAATTPISDEIKELNTERCETYGIEPLIIEYDQMYESNRAQARKG